MLELGDKSEEEHLKILNVLQSFKPEKVILVGSTFQSVSSDSGYKSFPDVAQLREYLKNEPIKGSFILIKGSRGMTLEKIYDLL
jgi:UDP-N-acetylmuramoyl-tripeptide--D-alanyl-D-alanine ligase